MEKIENGSYGISLLELIKRAKETPDPEFIWNGIQESSFGYVFGPSKSGKTTLSENLGMSIAAGLTEFMGMPINLSNRKVLFISLEEYWKPRTTRNAKQAQKISQGESDNWLNNFIVVDDSFPRFLETEDDWDKLEQLIAEHTPGVVFIDSMTRLVAGQIEDSKEAKAVGIKLRELTNKYATAIVCIHHTPKLNGKELTTDSLAGSRVLAQDADFAIGINRNAEGTRYIKNVFLRYADDSDDKVKTFVIDEYQWAVLSGIKPETKILQEDDGRRNEANRGSIFSFIQSGENGVLASQLMDAFVSSGQMVKSTLYACLEQLRKENKVVQVKKGVYVANRGSQAA